MLIRMVRLNSLSKPDGPVACTVGPCVGVNYVVCSVVLESVVDTVEVSTVVVVVVIADVVVLKLWDPWLL